MTENKWRNWTAALGVALVLLVAWSVIARLHHRSTAYGVFADSGGSNFLALGIRRRF